jgi:hypothetical protein
MDMICFMHEGEPYGHLKVKDKVILTANLSRMVGETLEVVEGWLLELFQAGVYDTTENGVIFSKRMVRDENLRQQRAAGGIKGGNPALMDKGKVNLEVISEVKQKPTPSSSSSSSSSIKNTNICPPSGEPDEKAGLPKCEHQAIVDLYHKHLPTLRRVEVWNDTRKGYLRQRWREVAEELTKDNKTEGADVLTWFAEFFDHIGESKFLTGRVNSKDGRPFLADLEWILKPSNFAKIVEGKYHGAN